MSLDIQVTHEGFKYVYGSGSPQEDSTLISSLDLAKGDWAAFQMLFCSDERAALALSPARLFSKYGKIPYYRLAVRCSSPGITVSVKAVGLMCDDDGQWKSDVLLSSELIDLEPEKAQPIWVELSTDAGIEPGVYQCDVRIYKRPADGESVFEDEELLYTTEISLTVKAYEMPSPSQYRMHLNLWQHPASIALKHEVPLWSDRHFEILEEYTRSLAELGQKCITVIVSEAPWSGQFCYATPENRSDLYAYNMIGITKRSEGQFTYDFSVSDRYIALCEKHGIRDRIELYGLVGIWDAYRSEWIKNKEGFGAAVDDYPDSIRLRYFDEATGAVRFIRDADSIKAYIRALYTHYQHRLDRVRVVADEPADMERFEKSIEVIRECAPGFKLSAAINHIEFVDRFGSRLADITPILPFAAQKLESLQRIRRAGACVSMYVCCVPDIPNTFLQSPAAESHILGILAYRMGLDGFLRWDYTVWTEDPRADIRYRAPNWKAGDTCFVYPGYDGKPVLSLRWKHLKRGVEDFELLLRAEEKVGREAVAELCRGVLHLEKIEDIDTQVSHKSAEELYSLCYEDYMALRRNLLDILGS